VCEWSGHGDSAAEDREFRVKGRKYSATTSKTVLYDWRKVTNTGTPIIPRHRN